ncbi:nuclear transport factor 2 family protein [Maribacter sp. TH_r10]|uniref:nuclear transport factor 2 family protein n=1 Tax=Maribacter sp. TH_r10 TaxID=3082086 RepID=UPI0029531CD5|nr:nuclear transport factor 2 family protein [Maribacter sp. TH_r10]MDV7140385.1 nuclear transport factor 2 family protein [Maribacter sp. TH_r10]
MENSQKQLEENKAIVNAVFKAITDGNWSYVTETFADDAKVWVAGDMPISGNHTKDFVRGLEAGNPAMFPNGMSLTPKAMTAEGDRVAVEAETYGEHFSGKTYNNFFHFLLVIRDGKIQEWKEYMDTKHASYTFFGE